MHEFIKSESSGVTLVYSLRQQISLSTYVLDAVLDLDKTVDRVGMNPCPHGAYTLVGRDRSKHEK